MRKFMIFFSLIVAVEFLAGALMCAILIVFDTGLDPLATYMKFVFFVYAQIVIRAIIGNYYFSWLLMKYLLTRNISGVVAAVANILSVLSVFLLLRFFLGDESDFDDMIMIYFIGLPMVFGVVVSSFLMPIIFRRILGSGARGQTP